MGVRGKGLFQKSLPLPHLPTKFDNTEKRAYNTPRRTNRRGGFFVKTEKSELFESVPVGRAVIALALPTVVGQLITVIYNMADTFFIGQLDSPAEVAAVQLAMPLFIFFNAIANLFGLGGASLISRSLGEGDRDRARNTSAFCIWSAASIALVYGAAIGISRPVLLPLLGASADSIGFCRSYVLWTIAVGAVPTVMNNVLAHMIRAEGYSTVASFGVAGGGILNMILDPIFIFGFNMHVTGAAVATLLSNIAASVFFMCFILKKRGAVCATLSPKYYTVGGGIPAEVVTVGLPSFMSASLAVISNMTLNRLMASDSDEAIAGMGIAKKIDMLAFAIAQGMTQGSLPLIGYNFTSGNRKRMNDAIKTTMLYCMIVSVTGAALLIFGADAVTGLFIDDAVTVAYGAEFLKIIAIACITTAPGFMVITIFQATGCRIRPLILSLLRKGSIDIPLMLIFNAVLGTIGIAWAIPIADAAALAASISVFVPYYMKLKKEESVSVPRA